MWFGLGCGRRTGQCVCSGSSRKVASGRAGSRDLRQRVGFQGRLRPGRGGLILGSGSTCWAAHTLTGLPVNSHSSYSRRCCMR